MTEKKLLPLLAIAAFTITGTILHAETQQPQAFSESTLQVVSCNDGDTCRLISPEKEVVKVRLVGIDAPETRGKGHRKGGQPMALEAKDSLNNLLRGKSVTLKRFGTDLYGRVLGEILIEGESVNLKLVKNGLAEVYRGNPPQGFDLSPFEEAETAARAKKIGIWGLSAYESPKNFRRKSK